MHETATETVTTPATPSAEAALKKLSQQVLILSRLRRDIHRQVMNLLDKDREAADKLRQATEERNALWLKIHRPPTSEV